jgi:fission 1 protein
VLDAADAESPLKESELQVLRSQYLKEQEAQHITVQTKFNYAWGLIKSEKHPDQLEGVKLLTGIGTIRFWWVANVDHRNL